jgi:hypothetical protein
LEDPLPFELLPLPVPLRPPEPLEVFGLLRELAADPLRELADLLFELFALLLELPDLLRELADPLLDALPLRDDDLLGLEPFELPEDDFRLVWERARAWAICSSLKIESPPSKFAYPSLGARNADGLC